MKLSDFVFPVAIVILGYTVNENSATPRPDLGVSNHFIEWKSEEELKAERNRKRKRFTLGAMVAFLIALIPYTFFDSRWAFIIPFFILCACVYIKVD